MPDGVKSVVIVGIDETLRIKFQQALGEECDPKSIVLCQDMPSAITHSRSRNPSLIAIEWDAFLVSEITEFLQKIRSIPRFAITPVVIISNKSTGDIAPIAIEYDVAKTLKAEAHSPEFKRSLRQIASELKRPDALRTKFHHLGIAQEEKNWKEANRIIESLYREFPNDHRAKIEYANLCLRQGLIREGLSTAKKALAFSPDNLRALNTIARAHLLSGNYNEAVRILERSNAVSPGNVERLVALGDGLFAIDQLNDAKSKYQQAHKIDEKCEAARQGLAAVELAQDNFNSAIEILRECQDEVEIASLYNNIGIMAVKKGRFRTAESSYLAAINALSQNALKAKIHFNLGLRFEREKNASKAAHEYKRALELSPTFAKCQNRLLQIDDSIAKKNPEKNVTFINSTKTTQASTKSFVVDDDLLEIETIDPIPQSAANNSETGDSLHKSFPIRMMLEKQKSDTTKV